MSEIKIKVTQDLAALKNFHFEPHVLKILDNKVVFNSNESVLEGCCQDIIHTLHTLVNISFRYEKNQYGHFFYIDSSIFDSDPTNKNIFTMFMTKFEIMQDSSRLQES